MSELDQVKCGSKALALTTLPWCHSTHRKSPSRSGWCAPTITDPADVSGRNFPNTGSSWGRETDRGQICHPAGSSRGKDCRFEFLSFILLDLTQLMPHRHQLLPPKVSICKNKGTLEANSYLFIFQCFKWEIIVWGLDWSCLSEMTLDRNWKQGLSMPPLSLRPNGMWEGGWNFWVLCTWGRNVCHLVKINYWFLNQIKILSQTSGYCAWVFTHL